MASGETLLKITDFPFAYSIIIVIFGIFGISPQNETLFILIGTAGALGTFLTIVDPVGWGIKERLRKELKKKLKEEKDSDKKLELKNSIKAVDTRAIGFEVDKLVSMGYFILLLFSFSTVIANADIAERLHLKTGDGEIVCGTDCVMGLGFSFSWLAAFTVFIKGRKNWYKLKQYMQTASVHRLGIGSEFVTDHTITNMSRSIEQNDWPTARKWGDSVEYEIKTEKGKKDVNIAAVREVYRPLFEESMQIQATLQADSGKNTFSTLPAKEWPRIRSTTANLMIIDENLRKEIEMLYEKIGKYNKVVSSIEKEIQAVIRIKGSEFYGKPIESVSYWFRHDGGGSSPALWDCLRRRKHPRETELEKPIITTYIELHLSGQKRESEELRSNSDIKKFDEFWKILVDEVEEKTSLLELERLPLEIQKMNNELKPRIEEHIRKQWL